MLARPGGRGVRCTTQSYGSAIQFALRGIPDGPTTDSIISINLSFFVRSFKNSKLPLVGVRPKVRRFSNEREPVVVFRYVENRTE